MGEFGDKFRRTREKREFSLDDVSHVTKIGVRMLRAIEEEHFDQLPGGIFNKGFIRAYAKHLGLNDEDAVNDYLACLRRAQIDAHEVLEPHGTAPAKASVPEKPGKIGGKKSEGKKFDVNSSAAKSELAGPVEELPELQLPRARDVRPRRQDFAGNSSSGVSWGIVGVAAVVLVVALLFWMRRSHGSNTAAASTFASKAVSAKLELAKLEPAKTESAKIESTNPDSAKSGSITTTSARVAVAALKPSTTSPAATPSSPPSLRAAPATTGAPGMPPSNANGKNNGDENGVAVSKLAKANPYPSAKASAPLTLVIRATETSWISVLADGQSVSHETLIAPAHTTVRATHEIVARVGNAAGVTFLWNGQEIPPDGAESEVKTFVFDSTGMRVVPSTPATQNR